MGRSQAAFEAELIWWMGRRRGEGRRAHATQ